MYDCMIVCTVRYGIQYSTGRDGTALHWTVLYVCMSNARNWVCLPKLEEKIGVQWYWQLLASMYSISESCWRLSQKKQAQSKILLTWAMKLVN